MRREGTETLLDALLVADIREDFMEDRELGAIRRRNMQSGLSHQSKETDGL